MAKRGKKRSSVTPPPDAERSPISAEPVAKKGGWNWPVSGGLATWFAAIGSLAGVVSAVVALWQWNATSSPATPVQIVPAPPLPSDGASPVPTLPDEQVPLQITAMLSEQKLDAAIELLKKMQPSSGRTDECQRILEFCLRNPTLDRGSRKATEIAMFCWEDVEVRKEMLEKIGLAAKRQE